MRSCPNCGCPIDDSMLFCPECGLEVVKKSSNNVLLMFLVAVFLMSIVIGISGCLLYVFNSYKNEVRSSTQAEDPVKERLRALAFADSVKKAKQDSIDFVNFSSLDLRTFGLHGHVKKVSTSYKKSETDDYAPIMVGVFDKLSFTFNGEVTMSGKIERNKGRISKIHKKIPLYYDEEFGMDFEYLGTDLSKVHICPDFGSVGISEDNYEWDTKGRIISIKGETGDHAGTCDMYWQFTYDKFDEYGNWISAQVKITEDWTSAAGEEYNSHSTRATTVKRNIEYYSKQ